MEMELNMVGFHAPTFAMETMDHKMTAALIFRFLTNLRLGQLENARLAKYFTFVVRPTQKDR